MGLEQWERDRHNREVVAHVRPRLDSDERLRSVLGVARIPWHGSEISLATTDARILFLSRDWWSGRLLTTDEGMAAYPIDVVSLLDWKPGGSLRWSRLHVRRPDRDFDLRLRSVYRDEAESIAAQLTPALRTGATDRTPAAV